MSEASRRALEDEIARENKRDAAEEMYEALKDATDQLEKAVSGGRIDTKVVNELLKRAAIAKAEGRS